MEIISLQDQLDEDQARLDVVLERKQVATTRVGKLFHGLRAGYLSIVVEQDLEALELEAYDSIPAPRQAE